MATDRDALSALYAALKVRQDRQRQVAPTVRDLPAAERLAYHRQANKLSRERSKSERLGQTPPRPTKSNVRAALADAALMLLATGGPGAAEVKAALATAFGRPGLPLALEAKAKSGELRPTLLTPEWLGDDRRARDRSRL